ncbi:pentapeptide repeat-containing protein [Nonomuraea fuscirosea]|uniref:pentapeptide repeat-containing protein n=1 Tax=Nonomuraea fuscirosea TaxID=1291556 RepID=UPI0034146A8C
MAAAATTGLMIALLIGPAARHLSGERTPITDTERKQMTVTERIEALNAARHTLIQAATGLVVIGGVAFTALGLWYTARTVDTAQQGQITDRYTKAVEQLGSAKQDVRLGGIYALQRLASDSSRDRDTVVAVLSAYVRGHDLCTLQPGEKKLPQACTVNELEDLANVSQTRPGADVVAALSVASKLALGGTTDADFSQVRFPASDLTSASLPGANLTGASLTGASLNGADLRRADLSRAHLVNADLFRANLSGAHLGGAYLAGAYLIDADLSNADLSDANLSGAHLSVAHLSGADLSGADLSVAGLSGVNLSGVNLRGASLRGADLRGADLSGANLSGANLRGANLSGAGLSGADLSDADLSSIKGKSEKEIRGTATVNTRTQFGS